MAENKTRRDFIITTAVATGSVAAAIVLQNETSHADTPLSSQIESTQEANIIGNTDFEQLKKDFSDELTKVIDNSDLFKLLEEYGLQGQGVIKFMAMLDLNQIEFSESSNKQNLKNSLESMATKEIPLVTLAGCIPPGGTCEWG